MDHRLAMLTLEELWQLFPIKLSDHNPEWIQWYQDVKTSIITAIGHQVLRITHIGSSAVPNLIAKPTIDILLEVAEQTEVDYLISRLDSIGFFYDTNRNKPQIPLMFKKGYTIKGYDEKVYHLHVRYLGDWPELYFKDYLVDHPLVCREYGKLKRMLLQQFEHDRDAYTEQKTAFIKKYTDIAKALYGDRYVIKK